MAVDTPARIAIIGAGPIGLEAALYARFLGYEVELFEAGDVGHHVRQWGHVQMFSPFSLNASPLGLAALHAQDPSYRPQPPDTLLTGQQWLDEYLLPLSQTDLLVDDLHPQTRVLQVSRQEAGKTHLGDRDASSFRLLVEGSEGERATTADIVIDTSGVFANPNWLGPGGAPAVGERDARAGITFGLPEILGSDRDRFAGQRTLVVGSGYSAATNVVALAELARRQSDTSLVWITRSDPAGGPVARIPDDPLAARDALACAANDAAGRIEHWGETQIEAIRGRDGDWEVTTSGAHEGSFPFQRILANAGYRPDVSITRELHVQTCYATEGPLKLAAALLDEDAEDCLQAVATGVELLRHPEPDFYVLGSKSYARNAQFLFATGLVQIRELFALIGDRHDLDLYQGARILPES